MAFDATGKWTPEDDAVAPKVNALVSSDSPLMQTARQSGVEAGNKRGLVNSSISTGVGEGAAYAAALPIASQDSAQLAQKNLATMQAGFQTDAIKQQGDVQSRLQSEQGTITGGLNTQQNAAEMARLQTQLANATDQQKADIQAQMDRLKTAGQLDQEKLAQSAGFQQQQTQLEGNINAAAQARQAGYDLSKLDEQGKITFQQQQQQLDNSMQQLQLNLAAGDREKATAAATSMMNSMDTELNAILANDKIGADARSQLIADNTARRQVALSLVGQLYNVNLTWNGQDPGVTIPNRPANAIDENGNTAANAQLTNAVNASGNGLIKAGYNLGMGGSGG